MSHKPLQSGLTRYSLVREIKKRIKYLRIYTDGYDLGSKHFPNPYVAECVREQLILEAWMAEKSKKLAAIKPLSPGRAKSPESGGRYDSVRREARELSKVVLELELDADVQS